MNIWLIQTGEPLPLDENIKKMRTSILADKLIARGHSVLWWTSVFDHLKKQWLFKKDTDLELKNGLKIKAIKAIGYKKNISLSRYIDHRIIAWKFKKMVTNITKPDIIVASMPSHDLAYKAVFFAKKNNVPVIVDIRDPWPDIFLSQTPLKFQPLKRMLLFLDFKMVRRTMQWADGLIAVTNAFLEWGLRYANRDRTSMDKVFYLGYKKNVNSQSETNKILKISDKLNTSFVVTFIGTFAHYHNPSILLDCAKELNNGDIQFVIAGEGEYFSEIKNKANKLQNVIVPGWLDQTEINYLLKYSHIGICPTPQTIDLFPNKVFMYLSAGLPVLSAFQGELKEIIEKYQLGWSYPPNDVDSLVSCIKKLYEDKKLYKKMSENAHRVFDEMFDADKIYDEYANHIERIVSDYREKRSN